MPYPVFALQKLGRMGRLYGGFPKFRYTRAGIPADIIRTFPVASLWNFAAGKAKLHGRFFLDEPKWVGNWVARHGDLAPVVWANGTAHRFLFPRIKDSGTRLILERGSMHPEDFFLRPQLARREAGYPYTLNIPKHIFDEERATKLAHLIIACSDYVRQSYLQRGYSPDQVVDGSFGIDTNLFPYIKRQLANSRPVRIGVVGVIGFRKGLFRILKIGDWAKKCGLNIEIHFAGPIQDPESHEMFAKSRTDYQLHGTIKGQLLKDFLASCDLYLLPSYEEGLPFSVLESMSTGLGAIVSNDTGAREAIEDGVSGINLTEFTEDEFEAKLAPLLKSPDRILAMGRAARARIESTYTLDHYCARIAKAVEAVENLK